jgi:ubiquinone/menaquinone biosynthesis C-methylase UbiE
VSDADATHLERIRAQFGRQADAYIRMQQTTDERMLNGLVLLSGAGPAARVLDVACGPGFLTMRFAATCASAVGLDATDTFLAIARAEAERRGLANVEFRSGDAEHLPFADATFGVVACRAAFHHFLHPERVLGEMTRVATPGGRVVIADMLESEDPAQAAYRTRIERLCDPTHTRALSDSELATLFAGAGLRVVVAPHTTMDYELEEWMAHGGPSPEHAAEIRGLMEASIGGDLSGLGVRRQDGKLWFTYRVAVFVLARAS